WIILPNPLCGMITYHASTHNRKAPGLGPCHNNHLIIHQKLPCLSSIAHSGNRTSSPLPRVFPATSQVLATGKFCRSFSAVFFPGFFQPLPRFWSSSLCRLSVCR